MTVAGVFFDLYGTLFVSADPDADWVAWRQGFEKALGRNGLQLPASARSSLSESFMARPEPTEVTDSFTLYEQRVHDFLVEMGLAAPADVVRDAADASAASWHEGFVPDPKAAPLLAHLRASGYQLALVSNFDHPPLLRDRLTACGLASAFDSIVVSAEIGARKPDPAAFRPALCETGLDPHQVVHVGDSADDVLGALAAGIRPIHLHRDGAPDIIVAGKVHRITSLAGLADLLDKSPLP